MGRVRRVLSGPVIAVFVVVAVVAVGAGLYWFQPWKVWQDETVQESLPAAAATPTPAEEAPAGEAPAGETPAAEPSKAASTPPEPTGPQTLARGDLISHEHTTSGTATVLRLADGSHVLRLEDLDTSNGPDLRVWLTDAPVKEGKAGWGVFDDGEHVSLGKLKGNKGDQNYVLPAGTDPDAYTSVSIWCDRFNVSFGAAELARA